MAAKKDAPGAGASEPKPEKDATGHTREFCWFLRQVVADHELPDRSVAFAIIYADHANGEDGLIFISKATAGRIRGRDERNVRAALKPLVDRKHLTPAGWAWVAGVRLKAYRWNLWDRRVEKRFDQKALGIAPAERNPAEHDEANRMKSSSSDAGDPAEAERRRGRSHPSEKDEVVRAKRTESSPNPSDSNRPTESAKNNNVVRLGEREVLEHEDDKLIEEIARLHPQKLTKNIRRQWRGDLWALQVRHGMDAPRELLLPAIQNALLNAARSGRHVITPTTTLAGRFEKAALSLRDDLKGLGAADRAYWREQFAAQCEAVIAARSPPAPKPTDGDAWLDAITPAQVAECDAMFDEDTPAEKRRARDRERRLRLKQEKRNVEKS